MSDRNRQYLQLLIAFATFAAVIAYVFVVTGQGRDPSFWSALPMLIGGIFFAAMLED